jgi:predicted nucleotide-binding protein
MTVFGHDSEMEKDKVVELLSAAGLSVDREMRNGNDDGWRLMLESGAIVNCYDSGTVNVQGRNQEPARSALALDTPAPSAGRCVPRALEKYLSYMVTILQRERNWRPCYGGGSLIL